MALEDSDLMPWGKHAGTPMEKVPAQYLLWLYNEKKCHGEVLTYIIDNMQVLEMQANAKKN